MEKTLNAGAAKEEIFEAATVAILTGSGTSMTYVSEVKDALDEYLP